MTNATPNLVFVIDDDARLRDDLVDYLLSEGYEAMGFASYEQFLPVSHRLQPDLILLDLGLPGLDGMDVCPLLRQRWPLAGLVMLTSRSGVEQQQAGLQAGADAYLSKTASLALVEATVASVLRRLQTIAQTPLPAAGVLDSTHKQPAAWTLSEAQLQLYTPQGQATVLTVNECRLVQAVLQAQGQSVPREVLLMLTGKPDNPSNRRNLDAVISRIRAKVRSSTGADLPLRASYANGYAFAAGRESDSESPATAIGR
jgi:DNA-binding response OmpR family regulator